MAVVDTVAVDEYAALVGDDFSLLEAERPELDAIVWTGWRTLRLRRCGARKRLSRGWPPSCLSSLRTVDLGATGFFEGVGFGCGDEVRPGGQALVVDLRRSCGHHERDGVRHSEKFGGRYRSSPRVPPPEEERGDRSASSSMSWKAVATLGGSTEKRLIVREGSDRVTHW